LVFCFQVNYTTNQPPLSGHRAPPLFRGDHHVPGDRRWRERLTDRPESLRRRKRQTLSDCLRWSPFDEQRGNLLALECEVVAELDRTSWKAAADLSGDNRLVTDFSDVGHLGVRLVFFVHLIAPLPDCSARVLSVFVGDDIMDDP